MTENRSTFVTYFLYYGYFFGGFFAVYKTEVTKSWNF